MGTVHPEWSHTNGESPVGKTHPERSRGSGAVEGHSLAPIILLWALIVAYASFFSAYTLQRHATLNTTAAELSSIDQAMWNTAQGRPLEQTVGITQAPRIGPHLELILLPLSLIYRAWDDVAAMLILQSLVLAAGALPVFAIAQRVFSGVIGSAGASNRRHGAWLALAFSLAYLLMPALQAANVTGFHTTALAVTPLLLAFRYGMEARWRPMWGWALLAMAAREDIALLVGAGGLLVMLSEGGPARRRQGLALLLASVAWYATVTILFPAAASPQARQGGVQSLWPPGSLVDLQALWGPVWRDALGSLLRSVGWLSLLAPEILLLGLPYLVTLATVPQHGLHREMWQVAAPLVPVFIIAAIYGARRLQRIIERQIPFSLTPLAANATIISVLGAVWLLVWAGSSQLDRGWTPLARPFQWPAMTAHHRTLARLTGQIPPDAAVSATPAIHPHLAHRQKIYVYPEVAGANYLLIDVTEPGETSALEAKALIDRLTGSGEFGIVDAADGYLLLARDAVAQALPDDFYSFTRADARTPEIAVEAHFGPGLRLLGYDVMDDIRWRRTHFRFYWQVTGAALPGDLEIRYEARTPAGALVDSGQQHPLPALLWRTPAQWTAGEVVVTETAPWFLPRAFAPTLQVTDGGQVLRAELSAGDPGAAPAEVAGDGTLRLPGIARRDGRLALWEGSLTPIDTANVTFETAAWTVRLAEWSAPLSVAPGSELTTLFYWQASNPAPGDTAVFLNLRDATGRVVAAVSGQPTWFIPRPATAWKSGSDNTVGVIDAQMLVVPEGVEPGRYELVVGWTNAQTGARFRRVIGAGNPEGDAAVLGPVTIDPMAGPRPDACCLAVEACCASME